MYIETLHALCCVCFLFVCLFFQIDSPPVAPPISPTLQNQLSKLISAHHYRMQQLIKQYDEPRPLSLSAFAVFSESPKQVQRLLALHEIALSQKEEKVKMLANREYIHGLNILTQGCGHNPLNVSPGSVRSAVVTIATLFMQTLKQTFQNFVAVCWFFVQAMKMALDNK